MTIFFNGVGYTYAQTLDEIKKQADEFFDNEEYAKAKPLYLKLVSDPQRAKDHILNYKYGTCLLYGNGKEKQTAIARLTYAVKKPSIDKRAYYFLAKAYHLNFQFDLAIKYYKKFKDVGSSSDIKKYNVDNEIDACNNGKRLLTNVTDMIVLQKTDIKAEDFYELYKLNNIGGTILVYDQFQSKYDKKMGHRPIIHFPKNSPFIYFSSYGEDGSTGLDIYAVKRLPNGKWSLAQKVIGSVNTFEDDNFPYMSPDRRFLYFSSKGHNSMGGYDVYRSRYNPGDNSFGKPENMDFAISSPDDDILYIVDSLDRIAYFTSARESEDGKLTVYKVRVEKIPMQMAVIKGDFVNLLAENNKNIEIVVSDYSNGKTIGTYNSKSKNGEFLITFPKSGKYSFIMTVDGQEISHQAVINIPYLKEFRPLKMKITHSKDGINEPQLVVEQLFDERFENPTAIMAEVYKNLSLLPPNSDSYDLDSLDKMSETNDIFVDAGLDPYATKTDVEKVVEDRIEDIEEQIETNQENSNVAYHLAEQKNTEAENKINEANNLITEAENESDVAKKANLFEQAYTANEQAKTLKREAEEYIELANKIDAETNQKNGELVASKTTLLNVKSVNDGDRLGLTTAIENNNSFFESQIKNPDNKSAIEKITSEGNKNKTDFSRINDEVVNLKKQKSNLVERNKNLEIDYQNAKKKKEKDRLKKIITANEGELELINSQISKKEKELEKMADSNETNLATTASNVQNPSNRTTENLKTINQSEKDNIQNKVNNPNLDNQLTKIDNTLAENGVAGKYVSLTGFDESRADFTDKEFEVAIDNEIKAQENLLSQTTDPKEKEKIQGEIVRLNKVKDDRVGGEFVSTNNQNNTVSEFDLISDYDTQKNNIANINDEKERRLAENKLNEDLIASIESEKVKVNKQLQDNPDSEALQSRLKELDAMYDIANRKIEENNNWIKGETTTVTTDSSQNYESVVENTIPNYENRINEIETSTELTPAEKTEQIKSLNQSALANTEEKIQEVNAILENDPNNTKAQDELTQLNTIKSDLEENPNKSLVTPSSIDDMAEVKSKVTNNEVLPNYDTQINTIQNSLTSDLEKEQDKLAVNQTLLNRINGQINEIENELKSDPKNKKVLNKRLKSLNTLKSDVENKISENENYIKSNSTNDIDSEVDKTTVATVTDVNPDYQTELDKINEIGDESEKNNAIKSLNDETIKQVDSKIETIQNNINNDPDNPDLKQELNDLSNLKTQLLDENQKLLPTESNDLSNISASVSLDKFMPTYNPQMDEINNSSDEQLKKEQDKINLNTALINRIDTEIEQLNEYVKTNPSNKKDTEKRLKNLKTIKSSKEKEIKTSQDYIDENQSTTASNTNDISVENINTSYESDMLEIEKIENESDKKEAINTLNQRTILIVDDKITEVENSLTENPNDENLTQQLKELNELKSTLENKTNEAADAEGPTKRYGSLTANVSTNDLISDYDSKMTEINSISDEIVKAEQNIELNTQLITKIDEQISGLNSYIQTNPTNKKELEKRIKNLNKLKTETQSKIDDDKNIVNGAKEVSTISINDLMPDYENKISETDNSNQTEAEKLNAKNNLNNTLISSIDNKIDELEGMKTAQPNKSDEIDEQIQKLKELKESKLNENNRNDELIASINTNNSDATTNNNTKSVNEISDLNESNFETEKGKNEFNNLKENFDELNDVDNEIGELETQKNNASSQKEKDKIDKQIVKKETEKAKIENEIITDLAIVNSDEINVKNAQIVDNSSTAKSQGSVNTDIKSADNKVVQGNNKIKEAKLLRSEAESEKDPILANNKLKRAIVLEEEAKILLDDANKTYKTAIIINTLNKNTPEVITTVPENPENRKSTQMFAEADNMNTEANYYENRAAVLRDSAETVKKKYKQAILIDAQQNEDKANAIRVKSTQLKENATQVKKQENELIAALPNNSNKSVDEAEKEETVTTETYKNYFEDKNAGDENMAEANKIGKQIKNLKQKSSRKIKMAVVTGSDINSIQNDAEVKSLQEEIDALTKQQEDYKNRALNNYANANKTLQNSDLSDDSKENIIALTNSNEKPKDKVIVEDPLLADFKAPNELNQDIFRTTEVPVYNSTNDIPVDAQQPFGLVYKVQIGAFRKEPAKTYFDKFAPVSGQSLNNGITRYMVGYFTNFTPANDAKNKVRGMGDYKDAFVVAYYNGKRISIAEARALEQNPPINNGNQFVNNANNDNTNQNNTTNTTTNTSNSNNNTTENNTSNTNNNNNVTVTPNTAEQQQLASYYTNTPNAATANQVEIMDGLFFTVQIGVYSKPVSPSVLFNVTPLNSQLTQTNKIRYTTGVYNSVADANARKTNVVAKGISDAFVTAYYNGKRITVAQARQILNQQGESVLFLNGATTLTNSNNNATNITDDNTTNYNQTEENNNKQTENNTNTTEQNNQEYQKENIYYRILIGKFEGQVPSEYANYLFNTEGVIFETETDFENNIYLYTTKQASISKVKEHLVELSELGIEDMKLVTYYNLEIIPFDEGQNIIDGTQQTEIEPMEFPDGVNADYLLYNPEAIYYRVELGKFSESVPSEFAALFLQIPENEVYHEEDIDGNEIFYTITIQSYQEADELMQQYKAQGFNNAKVVAFHKYEEISTQKAKSVKGK